MSSSDVSWEPPATSYEREQLVSKARRWPDLMTQDEEDWYLNTYPHDLGPVALGTEWFLTWLYTTQWRFSLLGLFWAFVGLFAIFVGTPELGFFSAVLGLVAVGYAVYLFAGGRSRLFVF